jgi:hypothetical protein
MEYSVCTCKCTKLSLDAMSSQTSQGVGERNEDQVTRAFGQFRRDLAGALESLRRNARYPASSTFRIRTVGATGGLAPAGMLDEREHTSNAKEFLEGLGYGGAALYRDEPVVNDGGLITAGAQAPIEFARAVFAELGIYEPGVLDSWYKLYGEKDPAGFYELMGA